MIRDIDEFRRTGVAGRRVADLHLPVETWRAAMCAVARRDGVRVRTFPMPATATGADDQLVIAVRVDPPPSRVAHPSRHVKWWRVAELGTSVTRWRAAYQRVARREDARVHTFVVPGADRTAFLVWVDAEPVAPAPALPPSSAPAPRPVTDLTRYAAARCSSPGDRLQVEGTEC